MLREWAEIKASTQLSFALTLALSLTDTLGKRKT